MSIIYCARLSPLLLFEPLIKKEKGKIVPGKIMRNVVRGHKFHEICRHPAYTVTFFQYSLKNKSGM